MRYGHSMKTKSKKKKVKSAKIRLSRRAQATTILAAVIILGVAACGATYHDRITQKIDKIRYGFEASHAFDEEVSTLSQPLLTFGIKKNMPSKCDMEQIYQYATPQLQCSVSENPYTLIGGSQTAKSRFVQQAGKLDALFEQNGWTETKNMTPSIRQWFQGITSGKDWYTDDGAFKNIGNSHCSVDFFVAFSNPKPPAFTMQTSCSAPVLQKYKNQL